MTESSNRCELSIVMPCFCSRTWLETHVRRIFDTVRDAGISRFEILLVNDASADDTWQVIEKLAVCYPEVHGYDLQSNVGQFRATICGMEAARGDYVLTMDDDGQHLPEAIPTLFNRIRSDPGIDCVVARFRTRRTSFFRRLGTFLREFVFVKCYGKPRDLSLSGFKVFNRSTCDAMCAHRTVKPMLLPILLATTSRICNVEVEHGSRSFNKSGYTVRHLVAILWNNVLFGSTIPLRFVGLVGFVTAATSVLLALGYVAKFAFSGFSVPGFATLVLLTLFFGGMTLFALGIVGEYLMRIVLEVTHPPRYFVRQTTERVQRDLDGEIEPGVDVMQSRL